MPETDLNLLIKAANEAGDIARSFFKQDPKTWEKSGNAGPVTEADLAVNAQLERTLRSARPNYGWLSEESDDGPDRLSQDRVFIIDPIDGTRSFIEGSSTWAHSLAIAVDGQITAAVVFLPMRDMLFAAEMGGGATLNAQAIAVSTRTELTGSELLATKPSLQPHHWKTGTVPRFTRHHRPSLAYRLSLVARGSFDGMLTLRPSWEWDIAAGALIITEAGGTISNKTGGSLLFNSENAMLDGVVAAGRQLHPSLLGALSSA